MWAFFPYSVLNGIKHIEITKEHFYLNSIYLIIKQVVSHFNLFDHSISNNLNKVVKARDKKFFS